MPAPISGTVVAAGSAVSPGGDTGLTGPAGSPPINSFFSLTAAYTFTSSDSGKYAICTGGSWTLTLPAPVLGMTYTVRNDQGITGTTGTITLQPSSGTIDGLASLPLLPGQECTIITDGTNWRTRGKQRTVVIGTIDIASAVATQNILLPVGYRSFEIELDITPSTDRASISGQFSIDGGNTLITTGIWDSVMYTSGATAVGYSILTNQAKTRMSPATQAGQAGRGGQAIIKLFPGDATGRNPMWQYRASGYDSTNAWLGEYVGVGHLYNLSGSTIVNFIQIAFSAGNIASGSILVRGIV